MLETTRHMAAMFGSCERTSSCSGSAVLNLQLAACNSTWGNRATAWMVGRIVMHLVMEALAEATLTNDARPLFTQASDYMAAQSKTHP